MNILTRLTSSFSASVDKAVSQVENHDAVIESAIRDCRRSVATARVRHTRVSRDGEGIKNKLIEAKAQQANWENRARAVAQTDERKALACMQRSNRYQTDIATLHDSYVQHEQIATKVAASLERVEKRLVETVQKRNLLQSRHTAANAMRAINTINSNDYCELDESFERWEMCVAEKEYVLGEFPQTDELELEFVKEEETQALKEQLGQLLENVEGE